MQSLRKGNGLTSWKLGKALELRNAIAEQTGIEAQSLTPGQLHSYLLQELDKLGDSVEACAVRNAFAVGQEDNPYKLTRRRAKFSQQYDRHSDTIETYENRGIEEIASRITGFNIELQSDNTAPEKVRQQINRIERTTNAARNMVIQGMADLYSLGIHSTEILDNFSRRAVPYLDSSIELMLLPSYRGEDWFTYKLRHTFRTQLSSYRIGIVFSSYDCEALMASGVIDDVIQVNPDADRGREIGAILNNASLVVHDAKRGTQTPLRFRKLDEAAAHELLSSIWRINADGCTILEVEIPDNNGATGVLYEYRYTVEFKIKERNVFWSAPGLMYLSNITVDFSRFPNKHNWRFLVTSFLGAAVPGTSESASNRYTLAISGWIMIGHGIAVTWNETEI